MTTTDEMYEKIYDATTSCALTVEAVLESATRQLPESVVKVSIEPLADTVKVRFKMEGRWRTRHHPSLRGAYGAVGVIETCAVVLNQLGRLDPYEIEIHHQ